MKRISYASAIGSIMYDMACMRPDVAYALSMTCKFQQNPGEEHWKVVKSILKYLRRTKEYFLVCAGQEKLVYTGYTDASFQRDLDDFKSQTGYTFIFNGRIVSWKSFKQATTADSTTEAEYIAGSETGKEVVAISEFLKELGVVPSATCPITIYCNNTSAIAQAKKPRSTNRNKHVPRKYYILRGMVEIEEIRLYYVPTDDNLADPFTKPLSLVKYNGHFENMGIRYIGDWL
ncbi:hypothetical protein RND71_021453 [Anisodus tanguticus]|uniref:Retrotransposon protein, putative, Ty1-copia subclass n=1 Tax=Anisodus tanguticus TaxID=243964 RepID=A0AAE1RXU8_9SOLA|nr:hypothetical protein RND71_021453 [Anisodus tanguticus]